MLHSSAAAELLGIVALTRSNCERLRSYAEGDKRMVIQLYWRTKRELKSSVVFLCEGIEEASCVTLTGSVKTVCGRHVSTVRVDLPGSEEPHLLCMLAMSCPVIININIERYVGAGLEVLLHPARNSIQRIYIRDSSIKEDPAMDALALPNLRILFLKDQSSPASTLMLLRSSQQLEVVSLESVELTAEC